MQRWNAELKALSGISLWESQSAGEFIIIKIDKKKKDKKDFARWNVTENGNFPIAVISLNQHRKGIATIFIPPFNHY